MSPALAGEFFTTEPPGKPYICINTYLENYRGLTHSKLLTTQVLPLKEVAETPTSLCWLHGDLLHRTAVWKALQRNCTGRHLTIMSSAR